MIQFLFVILIWIILVINAYFKMAKEEQQTLKIELKEPFVLFSVGLLVIGFLLSSSGIILAIRLIQYIGVTMIFISLWAFSYLYLIKNHFKTPLRLRFFIQLTGHFVE
ncbi:Fe3+-siderophore ABC transporter permease [Lysinibacillus cavernae]|uniref:Fe3+-siderophore ABC transporter permease n=1 Tax=Lysinibacillus cavernae TaxID=2666135 RepID=UPI001E496B3F|nr:Fe3+-siderophore ABC transporter permease [Lysinibacillus cavernae]